MKDDLNTILMGLRQMGVKLYSHRFHLENIQPIKRPVTIQMTFKTPYTLEAAARERKIEIQSVTYFKEDNKSSIVTKKSIKDFGISKQGELLSYEFIVTNSSENTITIDSRIPCACTTAEIQDKTLQPGASTIVKMTVDTKNLSGILMKSIYLQVQDSKEELQLYISSEVKE